MVTFAHLVIGPPGSGKSAFCAAVHQLLTAGLRRPAAVVNLDPANDHSRLPYECAVDIRELVTVEDVMETHGLGPNGAMLFCMEYLEANIGWLVEKLEAIQGQFLVLDAPGQVELNTHHPALKRVLAHLQKLDYRICAVHLVDSHYITSPPKYISALLLALTTMLHLELPHVNVLSKLDLLPSYTGSIHESEAYNLDFWTEVQDPQRLVHALDDSTPTGDKWKRLNAAMVELVEDYGLVGGFLPVAVEDRESVWRVVKEVDRVLGYHPETGAEDVEEYYKDETVLKDEE